MMEISHSIEEPDGNGNAVVKRLSVPVGLEELMTSLTKEVLKKKPIDIYNFASDHFGELLSLRESGSYPEPTAKIITYVNKVGFKTDNKSEKQLKDKQLSRQVSLNVEPFIQDFKIVGKKSVVLKSDKRNRREEAVKQKNEKLKANKKRSLSKQLSEKNLNLENDNKNKIKESNAEETKKNKKVLDKTPPSKGKNTKLKKRFKSVDNFTSFSNFSMNHNIIDPEDIQINSLDKDNISSSSENIDKKNYSPSALRKELIKIQDESKFTSFKSTYNPHKLRQEIKNVSKDEGESTDELENNTPRYNLGITSNEEENGTANTDVIKVLEINDDSKTDSKIEEDIVNIIDINEDNKVENMEEKVCSINESDIGEDKNNDEAVIINNNSNDQEVSVIEKEEIKNLEANGAFPADEHEHQEESVKEVSIEEKHLDEPSDGSNEEKAYNNSKIFASAGLAAVTIQSMWRGFRTRKHFPVISNNVSNLENSGETAFKYSGLDNDIISKAASKIQAGVKGYLTRKHNNKVVDSINVEGKNNVGLDKLKNTDELKEETQNVSSENVISNNNNVFSNVEQNDNLIESNENTQEVSLLTANSNNANGDDNQSLNVESLKEDEINILKLENYELNKLEGETKIQKNLNTDALDLNNENNTIGSINNDLLQDESNVSVITDISVNNNEVVEIETLQKENNKIDAENIEQNTNGMHDATDPLSVQKPTESNTEENKEINSDDPNDLPRTETQNTENSVTPIELSTENKNITENEENLKMIENEIEFKESTVNNEIPPDEINKNSQITENIEKNLISQENVNNENLELQSVASDLEKFISSSTAEPSLESQHNENVKEDSIRNNEAEENLKTNDFPTDPEEQGVIKSINNVPNLVEESIFDKSADIENESHTTIENLPQEVEVITENLVNENDNNKQGIREKRSLNFQEIIEEENSKLIDSRNNSKNIAINNEPKIGEINEEIKNLPIILMQPEVTESIEDNKEVQKDSTSEQESSKTDLPLGSILQHSGELHDVPTYFNKENKLSSDSSNEILEKEDIKSLSNLEHSSELHDIIIVEKNNTLDNETSKPDGNNTENVEHQLEEQINDNLKDIEVLIESSDGLYGKDMEKIDNNESINERKEIHVDENVNSNVKLEDTKVEKIEENCETTTEDTSKLPSELHEIEETIKTDDNADVHIEVKESEIEKHSPDDKDRGFISETELKVILEPTEEILKADSPNKPNDSKLSPGLSEMDKSKVPEDDLIQAEKTILQLTELPSKSKKGVDSPIIEDVKLLHLHEETMKPDEIVNMNTNNVDISKLPEELDKIDNSKQMDVDNSEKQETSVLELSIGDNKFKTGEIEEELMEKKISIVNAENTPHPEVENDVSEVTANLDDPEKNKSEENVDVESEAKAFDLTKLRAELDEAKNITKEDTNLVPSHDDKNSFEKEEYAEIVENVEFDLTKLRAELDEADKINKEDTNFVTSTEGKESFENNNNGIGEKVTIEENIEVEGNIKKFDLSKLRTELDEAENIGKEDTNLVTSIEGKDSSENNGNEKEENADIKENIEIESDVKTFDLSKLRAELDEADSINKEDIHLATSTEGKDSFENNNNETPEKVTIEENLEVEGNIKKFDLSKLRAELDEAENIDNKDTNLVTSIEGKDSSENNNNEKEENTDIKENIEIASDLKKFDLSKLRAELDEAESVNKEDTPLAKSTEGKDSIENKNNEIEEKAKIDENIEVEAENISNEDLVTSTKGQDSSENNNNGKEENTDIKENIEVESDAKKIDLSKLRAELDKVENINKDETNLATSTVVTDSFEKNNNNNEIEAKITIEENIEVEDDKKKFDLTKLRAELDDAENVDKEDTNLVTSKEGKDSSEDNSNEKEENTDIKENIEVESNLKKFDLSKLHAELDEAKSINKEDTNLATSIEVTDSFEKNNNEIEEKATIEENMEVEEDKNKFDVTKLRAELDEAKNVDKEDTNLVTSKEGKDSSEDNSNEKEENTDIKENIEVESNLKKFDLSKLHAELDEAKSINKEDTNLATSIEVTDSFEKNNNEIEEKATIEENMEVEEDKNKFDLTKLRAELDEAKNVDKEDTNLATSIEGKDSSENNSNEKEENTDIKENTEVESDAQKFDLSKLRAELVEAESINKEDTNLATSTEEKNNNEIEEKATIEENIEGEGDKKQFDLTKLRAELDEVENVAKEDANLVTPIEGKDSSENNSNEKEENTDIKENIEVDGNVKKFDLSKLRSELDEAENINKDESNLTTSAEGTDSFEKNKNEIEEKATIEENIEVDGDKKKFDLSKLRTELDAAENIIKEDVDVVTSTEGRNSPENSNNGKGETVDIKENIEVDGNVKKFDLSKLRAELDDAENINKEETNIATSTEEKNNNEKEEKVTIKENIEVESDVKKFDLSKLRAELDEAENTKKEDTNLATSSEAKDGFENNNENEGTAEIEENIEAKSNLKKFDLTKLRAELDDAKSINKDDTNFDKSTEGKECSEKNQNGKEENAENEVNNGIIQEPKMNKEEANLVTSSENKIGREENANIEENVEVERNGKKFDLTKLRTELDEADKTNISTEDKDSADNNKDGKVENTEIKEEVEVEGETTKFDITKLRAELSEAEEMIKNTPVGTSTEDKNSFEKNADETEQTTKIEGNEEVESEIKKFDITKLRSELDEIENSKEGHSLDEPIQEKEEITLQMIDNHKLKTDKSEELTENRSNEENKYVSNGSPQFGLKVTLEDAKVNDNEEISKIGVNEDFDYKTNKFDLSKLRAELDEIENAEEDNSLLKPIEEVNEDTDSLVEADKSEEDHVDVLNNSQNLENTKENGEVGSQTNKFDLSKLRAELDEIEEPKKDNTLINSTEEKEDTVLEFQNDKNAGEHCETKSNKKENVTPTIGSNIKLENLKGNDIEESAKIEENGKNENKTSTLDEVDKSKEDAVVKPADENDKHETNINEPILQEELNKEQEDVKHATGNVTKLASDLPSNDDSSVNNIKESTETEENKESDVISNKSDITKLGTELNDVKKVPEEELSEDNKNLQSINENKSHGLPELEGTPQLHLIDNDENNDAIKSNTTDDVNQQLTVINNDMDDGNKCIKNVNTSQLEQPTPHSNTATELEFVPTESSDNLIVSPNDSNQTFSNKEVEAKINKEVVTNTNQASNFNQASLNNETNSMNQQDDTIDERALSGISASPDSDVTVIFNTNSSNKLDDNSVNISGNSSPTVSDKTETVESGSNDMLCENLENKDKNSFDTSKLSMEIENPEKGTSQEEGTQGQKEQSMNESNSEHQLKEDKIKDTLHNAATVIQSTYRGHQVRTKLKDSKKEQDPKTDESNKEGIYSTDQFNLNQTKKDRKVQNEDFAISDALGNVLNQQLAITAPNAVEVDKSETQPEYIHIPLKGSIDESNPDQKRSSSQLQHSGEFHDIFPISNVSGEISNNKRDETVTHEDSNIKKEMVPSSFTENKTNLNEGLEKNSSEDIENEKQTVTDNSLDDDKNFLKLNKAVDGSVPQALEVVLNQQLAIATPCAKLEENDKSGETEKVDYIHIPLNDPNVSCDNGDVNAEREEVDVTAETKTSNSLNKDEKNESANINDEAVRNLNQFNRSTSDVTHQDVRSEYSSVKEMNESVKTEDEKNGKNKILVNYSIKADGSIPNESMPMVVQNTQLSESTMPVEVQPNQAPGAEILTSPTSVDETEASLIIENAEEIAQTSEKDASSKDEPTKNGAHLQTSMETSNRENTTPTEQNMENVAATKIQASFRGYQVRKQLKPKILKIGKSLEQLILLLHNGGVDSITLRRSLRRKSSGKLRGSENILKKQKDKSSDLEEKSATKIQAGIRGFLVRRRQTKANTGPQKSC